MRGLRSVADVLVVLACGLTIFFRMGYIAAPGVHMTIKEFADLAGGIKDVATTIAILVGGGWALGRFWRERESVPRLQLDLNAEFVQKATNACLVAVKAHIENKGKVRHEIRLFDFHLSVVDAGSIQTPPPVCIEYPIETTTGSLMPKDAEYSFIEPGVRTTYFELVAVPATAKEVYIYCSFEYGGKEYEEAECIARNGLT